MNTEGRPRLSLATTSIASRTDVRGGEGRGRGSSHLLDALEELVGDLADAWDGVIRQEDDGPHDLEVEVECLLVPGGWGGGVPGRGGWEELGGTVVGVLHAAG